MDKNPDKSIAHKSYLSSLDLQIDEIIRTIQKVDTEIERFYEIHGTEVHVQGHRQPSGGESSS